MSTDTFNTIKEMNDEEEYIDLTEEKYQFKTNVCRRLSKILEIPEINYDENFIWEQPKESGLSNCNLIIPNYYKKPHNKIVEIDYYEMIKDDIRNCRKLNEYQLKYIMELNDESKNELLLLYNSCINILITQLNDLLHI